MSRIEYRYGGYGTRNILFVLPFLLSSGTALSEDITAGTVMTRMGAEERYSYLAGIIEGLAYARYKQEGSTTPGMACIYKWFYETEGTLRQIHSAFEHFADYTPGAVIAAMVEKDCGS